MDRETLTATLYLHAVLPRVQELVKLDEEAGRIASEMNAVIRFRVKDGPRLQLNFSGGQVTTSPTYSGSASAALFFPSCAQLNKMFRGEKVFPIPYKGLTHIKDLNRFTALSEILPKYLQPSETDIEDPAFRPKHVEMALMAGLSGAAVIAHHDPHMAGVAANLRDGVLMFTVEPDGPSAHVIVRGKDIRAFNGHVDDADAILSIRDMDMAVDLLADKLDAFAHLGAGDIKATGLLPLADEYSALMDRVAFYIN